MEKYAADYVIEPPKPTGDDCEFFVQKNGARKTTCSAHIHSAVELLYIKSGSYKVMLDNREFEVSRGDLALFCSNSIHHVMTQNCPSNEYYVIKISPSFLFDFSKKEMAAAYITVFALNRDDRKKLWTEKELEGNEIKYILDRLIKEYEAPRYASEISIRLMIMELLVAILREDPNRSELVSDQTAALIYRAMLFARENYSDTIDERELAKDLGMSYSFFVRSFRKISNLTFRNYLNVVRIHRAQQLLYTSDESITQIALKCGYAGCSYFIEAFRKVTGKTPRRFREEVKIMQTDK